MLCLAWTGLNASVPRRLLLFPFYSLAQKYIDADALLMDSKTGAPVRLQLTGTAAHNHCTQPLLACAVAANHCAPSCFRGDDHTCGRLLCATMMGCRVRCSGCMWLLHKHIHGRNVPLVTFTGETSPRTHFSRAETTVLVGG